MKTVSILDGGPLYAETDMSCFIVEPWNAISSLILLIPAIYWFLKVRHNVRQYAFLCIATILLVVGGTGSTLYHAFRSSSFLLMMDVLPIQVLTLLVIVYFWAKVLKNRWWVFAIMLPFFIIKGAIFQYLHSNLALNLSYFINGLMLFLPAILYLVKTRFRHMNALFLSISLFAISLFFRHIDHDATHVLYMGTHWLWHIFSAAGAGILGEYLYRVRKEELQLQLQDINT